MHAVKQQAPLTDTWPSHLDTHRQITATWAYGIGTEHEPPLGIMSSHTVKSNGWEPMSTICCMTAFDATGGKDHWNSFRDNTQKVKAKNSSTVHPISAPISTVFPGIKAGDVVEFTTWKS